LGFSSTGGRSVLVLAKTERSQKLYNVSF
jgi:hypothetical protein